MDSQTGKQGTATAGQTNSEGPDRRECAAVCDGAPIFEIGFVEHSCGFRPGRSARQAVERVESLLETGHIWVVDADIKGYFDNIPQEKLQALVREKIADSRVLALLEKFLRQGVMDTVKGGQPTENGTPQGAVICQHLPGESGWLSALRSDCPLLANIYLNPLDQLMVEKKREMTRYADDFGILCCTEAEAINKGPGRYHSMDGNRRTHPAP